MEIEKYKEEAKEIMDKFVKALEKVSIEQENFVERDEDRRVEEAGESSDNSFREIMFLNAPLKKEDFIIAEKKKW